MFIEDKHPVFIPQVGSGLLLSGELSYALVCAEDAFTKNRKNIFAKALSHAEKPIIYPSTNRIVVENASTVGMQDLPYFIPSGDAQKLYIDADYRLNKFVIPCINFQLEHNPAAVIAPFVHSEGPHSQSFNINISLLVDSVRHLVAINNSLPIYGVIPISAGTLLDLPAIDYLIGRYIDDFPSVEGYFVLVDSLKEKTANEFTLKGLVHLIHHLSSEKRVVPLKFGILGEVLVYVGANGYSSGLESGESFSMNNYTAPVGPRRTRAKWTYVPEIMGYLNDEDVLKIDYETSMGKLPLDAAEKKMHIFSCKVSRMAELSGMDQDDLLSYGEERIKKAMDQAQKWRSDHGLRIETGHLNRYLEMIRFAKIITTIGEETVDLDKLLAGLDETV